MAMPAVKLPWPFQGVFQGGFQALEDIMHVIRITSAKRTRGRKALGYVPIKTFEEVHRWIARDLLQQMKAGR